MGDDPLARNDPPDPTDGPRLFFDGFHLRLTGGSQRYHYPATSGKPLTPHRFDYSLAHQRLADTGPIPEGTYRLDLEERDRDRLDGPISPPSDAPSEPRRIDLHPLPTTETYGRGGFFIHGGTTPGSAGCIDLTDHMDQFLADLRRELSQQTQPGQIHLDVFYVQLGDFPLPKGDTRIA